MRIHHIVNSYSLRAGGAERVARRIHEVLLARGFDSHLLGILKHDDDEVDNGRSLGLESAYSWSALRGVIRYMAEECREGDIVHAHLFPSMMYCGLGRRKAPVILIGTEHNTSNRRRGSVHGRIIDGWTYRHYDRVACVSGGTERALLEWIPGLTGRTRIVPNGIRLIHETPAMDRPSRRAVILSAGRLTAQKNYEQCLRAVSLLGDLDVEYWIAGDGEERGRLEPLIEELGVAGRVKFLGFVDDLPEVMDRADIFLIASKWEGFGLVAAEAMNAGLPVVASNVDGLREVVGADDSCGTLVEPGNVESIAAALRTLVEDPVGRRAMGEAGFRRSLEFSEDRMMDSYVELYEGARSNFAPAGKKQT